MRPNSTILTIFVTSLIIQYVSSSREQNVVNDKKNSRITRQTNADQMVQNILRWLQGVYTQQSRRIRQGTLREYLPPSNTQKPRPFEPRPSGDGTDENGVFVDAGYPPAGITPQPPFVDTQEPYEGTRYIIDTRPTVYPGNGQGTTIPPPSLPTSYPDTPTPGRPKITTYPPGYTRPQQTFGTSPPPRGGYDQPKVTTTESPVESDKTPYPTPGFPTYQPDSGYTDGPYATGRPRSDRPSTGSERPGFPTYSPTVTPERPAQPTQSRTSFTSEKPGYPTGQPGYSTGQPGYPTGKPGYPTGQPTYPTDQPGFTSPGYPSKSPFDDGTTESPRDKPSFTSKTPGEYPSESPREPFTSVPVTDVPRQTGPGETTDKIEKPGPTEIIPGATTLPDDDLRHPPHIHAINVDCGKEMMTIHIEFNREFNGIIYSKGYYHMPECRYVSENSGQTKFTFTVNLNMCGTEFINAFDSQNQSYLENVLVLQNEVGIQEIWDTVRAVRCLWEGNLKEQLSVSLMVGMLTQEIVTFSGDTAMAKLDIVSGRGAFGRPVNGLIKIGEPMTLVVSVSGDPGFDIQVKDCRATDISGTNTVQLSDEEGCILKPKLFGAFQKTRNTENTGASIIAYAYFNAFKFPDVMDLMIECNIELCKTDCNICTNPNQSLEPAKRKRRDTNGVNDTLHNAILMGKHLRVVLAEDLAEALAVNDNICMTSQNFLLSSFILFSLLTASCLLCTWMWFKMKRLQHKH